MKAGTSGFPTVQSGITLPGNQIIANASGKVNVGDLVSIRSDGLVHTTPWQLGVFENNDLYNSGNPPGSRNFSEPSLTYTRGEWASGSTPPVWDTTGTSVATPSGNSTNRRVTTTVIRFSNNGNLATVTQNNPAGYASGVGIYLGYRDPFNLGLLKNIRVDTSSTAADPMLVWDPGNNYIWVVWTDTSSLKAACYDSTGGVITATTTITSSLYTTGGVSAWWATYYGGLIAFMYTKVTSLDLCARQLTTGASLGTENTIEAGAQACIYGACLNSGTGTLVVLYYRYASTQAWKYAGWDLTFNSQIIAPTALRTEAAFDSGISTGAAGYTPGQHAITLANGYYVFALPYSAASTGQPYIYVRNGSGAVATINLTATSSNNRTGVVVAPTDDGNFIAAYIFLPNLTNFVGGSIVRRFKYDGTPLTPENMSSNFTTPAGWAGAISGVHSYICIANNYGTLSGYQYFLPANRDVVVHSTQYGANAVDYKAIEHFDEQGWMLVRISYADGTTAGAMIRYNEGPVIQGLNGTSANNGPRLTRTLSSSIVGYALNTATNGNPVYISLVGSGRMAAGTCMGPGSFDTRAYRWTAGNRGIVAADGRFTLFGPN